MAVPTVTLNNGVTMPQLGFGTWQVGYDAVAAALAAGYRCFDTAEMYRNETAVAAALADSGLDRSDVFITTKLWNNHHGFQPALDAFHASRRRLGLDVIDLYLIHWPNASDAVNVETWRALEQLYAEGVVRAIGVSNFSPAQLAVLLEPATWCQRSTRSSSTRPGRASKSASTMPDTASPPKRGHRWRKGEPCSPTR